MNTSYGDKIVPGTIIAYRLLPEDMPKNPNKVWRGKVLRCDATTMTIEMLEPGYDGLSECITYEQVIAAPQE